MSGTFAAEQHRTCSSNRRSSGPPSAQLVKWMTSFHCTIRNIPILAAIDLGRLSKSPDPLFQSLCHSELMFANRPSFPSLAFNQVPTATAVRLRRMGLAATCRPAKCIQVLVGMLFCTFHFDRSLVRSLNSGAKVGMMESKSPQPINKCAIATCFSAKSTYRATYPRKMGGPVTFRCLM